jgi:hypothetical protein
VTTAYRIVNKSRTALGSLPKVAPTGLGQGSGKTYTWEDVLKYPTLKTKLAAFVVANKATVFDAQDLVLTAKQILAEDISDGITDKITQEDVWKANVLVLVSDNFDPTSAAPDVADGVALTADSEPDVHDGDRILYIHTGDASLSGIWRCTSVGTGADGVWERDDDANTSTKLHDGATVHIEQGTYADKTYQLTTNDPFVLGVDGQTWTDITSLVTAAQVIAALATAATRVNINNQHLQCGALETPSSGIITIAAGSVTPVGGLHVLAPQGGVDDDLDTINPANFIEGGFLVLIPDAVGPIISLREVGNILLPQGFTTLPIGADVGDLVMLQWIDPKWHVVSHNKLTEVQLRQMAAALTARLDLNEKHILAGGLELEPGADLTIDTGALSGVNRPTHGIHSVITEGAPAVDTLETIDATNFVAGGLLLLRGKASGDIITIVTGSGNIRSGSGNNSSIGVSANDWCLLVYDGVFWHILLDSRGGIQLGDVESQLDIVAGVLSPSGSTLVRVDTQGDAAIDDLDTIDSTNYRTGQMIVLRPEVANQVVRLTTSGNIVFPSSIGSYLEIGHTTNDRVLLQWNSVKWVVLAYNTNIPGYLDVGGVGVGSFYFSANDTAEGDTLTLGAQTYTFRAAPVLGTDIDMSGSGAAPWTAAASITQAVAKINANASREFDALDMGGNVMGVVEKSLTGVNPATSASNASVKVSAAASVGAATPTNKFRITGTYTVTVNDVTALAGAATDEIVIAAFPSVGQPSWFNIMVQTSTGACKSLATLTLTLAQFNANFWGLKLNDSAAVLAAGDLIRWQIEL